MPKDLIRRLISCAGLLAGLSQAAWEPPLASEWQDITPNLNAALVSAGLGAMSYYNAAGITIDRATGTIFATPSEPFSLGLGLWRSNDKGQTFTRVNTTVNTGNSVTWLMGSLFSDAEGGKIAVMNTDNGTCGFSVDTGKTWHTFTSFERNWDAGAINWQPGGNCKFILAMAHEGRGLYYSVDSGKTWNLTKELGSDDIAFACGVFDSSTLVASEINGKTIRSTDAGKTWHDIGSNGFVGPLQFFKGNPYWLSNTGVQTTSDSGATWDWVGDFMLWDPVQGPFFGKDEKHMVVVTSEGFMETRDGGKNWYLLAPMPIGFYPLYGKGAAYWFWVHNFGYDPVNDILYAQQFRSDGGIYKLVLGRDSLKMGIRETAVASPQPVQVSNYPNPFHSSTSIHFRLSGQTSRSSFLLKVYNSSGQLVRTLTSGKTGLADLETRVIWDGKDDKGRRLEAGVYFYRLNLNGKVYAKSMVYTR